MAEEWTIKQPEAEETPQVEQQEQVQEEPTYQTPTNEDGDYTVNLDSPPNIEDDAVQERETTEISLDEQPGDSQEMVEEVREQPEQEASEPAQEFALEEVADEEPAPEPTPEPTPEPDPVPEVEIPDLPEGVDKLVEFMKETGGTVQDYIALNTDYSQMNDVDVLREFYRQTKPHFDASDIEFDMNKKFYYDQETMDESEIRAKQLAFKEELYKAQQHLNGQKEKYYQELKLNPKNVSPEYKEAMEFYNNNKVKQEESKKLVDNFHKQTDTLFNDEFKGFDFNVGDKKFRVKVADVNKTKEYQKDINNWINGFIGEDGTVSKVADYHKGLYVAANADKLAQHFYEQGRSDAIKESAAKAKNIDMAPRQDAGSITTPSGNKFKVVSGQSSNSLRINMKR